MAASSPALLLENDTIQQVIVHPLVLFHILDHHTRRQEASSRVIGTLLGHRQDGVVEITNCFSVPHAERGDEVAIGKDFNKTMMQLSLRTNRKETVVGWYATMTAANSDDEPDPPLIPDTSALIHDFYASETDEGDPVHIVVDTRLKEDQLNIRAYKSKPILLQNEPMGNIFQELSLKLQGNEPEKICLHEMVSPKATEKDALLQSMEKLYTSLEKTLQYVDAVVDGTIPADAAVGRQIDDALAVPRMPADVLDRLFHESLQDLLMVSYLSNITRTQLIVAEKLNASLGAV